MNREQAKQYIKDNPEIYLKEDNSGKGYICPICGSGTGPKGTGITTKDNEHYTCWAGCFTHSDIIDIIGLQNGITDTGQKFNKAYEIYGINVDEEYTAAETENKEEVKTNYKELYKQANNDLDKTNYLLNRGISKETAERFNIGFIENWYHPKDTGKHIKPVIIIPITDNIYFARDTRANVPKKEQAYTKTKVGGSDIFNFAALSDNEPIYIVEGEIDALSIIELGYSAAALGTVTNKNKLIKRLEESQRDKEAPILIALDNDEAGKEPAEELQEELTNLGYLSYRVSPFLKEKDANEALINKREEFKKELEEWAANPKEKEQAELIKEYDKINAASYINDFLQGVKDSANTREIKTGFSLLDDALDGGLYEGLYILGAVSSLGKTTFLLQVADQIAQQGQDVLIISLEMSRYELMAKSISRNTIINCLDLGIETTKAKTNRGITNGKKWQYYSDEEIDLINKSVKDYSQYANNIYILEGLGDIGVEKIRKQVEEHTKIKGKPPVVIVDYLQILAPYNERYTERMNTDYNVRELKRISRDYKIPVITISSFNRDNYKVAVSMIAFKESGGIEYSSDVLMGLQFKGMGTSEFDLDEAKDKNPREIQLKILKNRNGKTGTMLEYAYYPFFNYFREVGYGK